MKISNMLAAAGAILALSAGAALAVESCECCKDMAADAEMSCCDKMKPEPAPTQPAPPASPPSDAPAPQGPSDR